VIGYAALLRHGDGGEYVTLTPPNTLSVQTYFGDDESEQFFRVNWQWQHTGPTAVVEVAWVYANGTVPNGQSPWTGVGNGVVIATLPWHGGSAFDGFNTDVSTQGGGTVEWFAVRHVDGVETSPWVWVGN
jgi:hypothetical protein